MKKLLLLLLVSSPLFAMNESLTSAQEQAEQSWKKVDFGSVEPYNKLESLNLEASLLENEGRYVLILRDDSGNLCAGKEISPKLMTSPRDFINTIVKAHSNAPFLHIYDDSILDLSQSEFYKGICIIRECYDAKKSIIALDEKA